MNMKGRIKPGILFLYSSQVLTQWSLFSTHSAGLVTCINLSR